MDVLRQLLQRSTARYNPGDHGALDATFFAHQAASNHYIAQSDRHRWTLKATALVETESCAILAVRHTGPTIPRWASGSVAQYDGNRESRRRQRLRYDDQSLRDALRAAGVRPIIRHRLFAAYDHVHNVRLDSGLYEQR